MTDDRGSEPPSPGPPSPDPPPRGPAKGPTAFRTISEASAEVGVPQHVLRFWETRFAFIRPTKRAGGRRFYRPQDLEVLRGVRVLLQDEGYTIKGVQKLHREQGLKRLIVAAGAGSGSGSGAEVFGDAAPSLGSEPPPPEQDERPAAPALVADAEPETRDLFVDAPPPPAPPPPPVAVAPAGGPSPVLDARARTRLSEVLGDLETTKDRIDALLRGG